MPADGAHTGRRKTDRAKLYALHAPEVECLAKCKAHKRDEFGVKVSVAATNREGLVVGMLALLGNPYDGHTLAPALAQVERLTGVIIARSYVDCGYRVIACPNAPSSTPASAADSLRPSAANSSAAASSSPSSAT